MQQIVYRDAPYDILYYSSELQAYRIDKWHGYKLQPRDGGTPFFSFGVETYLSLQAGPEPTPTPAAPSAGSGGAGSPAASPGTEPGTPASSNSLPLVVGIVALIAVVAVGLIVIRGRRPSTEDEEE